jgi:uncharacterized protein involved in exopolysaccharide biosynthesis
VLQTLGSDETYRSREPALGEDHQQGLNLVYYLDILKRRFFYFLGAFGLVSILGLYLAAIQQPIYLSEGKILVQSQEIAPDIVTPVMTATASERTQLIQQRVMTRDHLLLIASRFGLFPHASDSSEILELMRKSIQIKPVPVEFDGQLRPNSRTVAFTVGFQYENPELAMRVANEFVTLIVSSDERSRSSRTTEMVNLLTSQTKDIEDKLESTQMQILEVARRPRETIPETPGEQKTQVTALAALKAELVQKTSVYSDAHPVVAALKKRIAATEKNLAQPSQVPAQAKSTADDDIEALKRQGQILEKRLADANGKLASARLSEKLDQEQQSERMQVIESPSLPEKPLKSKKIMIVGIAFAGAAMLGIGAAIGPELLNGSIRSRDQLSRVVASSLIVCIPYIATRADIIRTRLKVLFGVIGVVMLLAALGGLAAAIVFHLRVPFAG